MEAGSNATRLVSVVVPVYTSEASLPELLKPRGTEGHSPFQQEGLQSRHLLAFSSV
jgi:hypothetical protein